MSHTVFPGAGDQDRIATKPGHGPGTGGPSTSAVTGRSGSKSGSRSEPRGGSRDGSRSETEPITGRRRATGWPTETERFTDRAEAGRALGAAIANHVTIEWSDQDPGSRTRPLVLGLSRGGVVVASEIATAVDGDLDVVVVRKVGLPWQPACGVGAIADEGPVVFDHGALAGAGTVATALTPSVRMQRLEVRRQHYRYRGDRPAPSVAAGPLSSPTTGWPPSPLPGLLYGPYGPAGQAASCTRRPCVRPNPRTGSAPKPTRWSTCTVLGCSTPLACGTGTSHQLPTVTWPTCSQPPGEPHT